MSAWYHLMVTRPLRNKLISKGNNGRPRGEDLTIDMQGEIVHPPSRQQAILDMNAQNVERY
jgi:hypothetical protein